MHASPEVVEGNTMPPLINEPKLTVYFKKVKNTLPKHPTPTEIPNDNDKTPEELEDNTHDKQRRGKWYDDGKRHRCWLYTQFARHGIIEIPEDRVQYHVYQLEECPKTLELHYQGYVQMKNSITSKGMKNISSKAHWEDQWGTHKQARAYCMKEESRQDGPWEYGEFTDDQGKRNDIDGLKDDLIAGMKLIDIRNKHFKTFIRYNRGINEWIKAGYEHRDDKPEVWLITGPTGAGKTRLVYDKHGIDGIHSVTDNNWFCGYEQQPALLFDEVEFAERPIKQWKQILDRYPYRVNIKGSSLPLKSPDIYLTNSNWEHLRPFTQGDLRRRITGIITFVREQNKETKKWEWIQKLSRFVYNEATDIYEEHKEYEEEEKEAPKTPVKPKPKPKSPVKPKSPPKSPIFDRRAIKPESTHELLLKMEIMTPVTPEKKKPCIKITPSPIRRMEKLARDKWGAEKDDDPAFFGELED